MRGGGRRGEVESGETGIWILTGGRTVKEAWRRTQGKKRGKRERKGNNNI